MDRSVRSRSLAQRILHAGAFAIPGEMFAIQRAIHRDLVEALIFAGLGIAIAVAMFFLRFK